MRYKIYFIILLLSILTVNAEILVFTPSTADNASDVFVRNCGGCEGDNYAASSPARFGYSTTFGYWELFDWNYTIASIPEGATINTVDMQINLSVPGSSNSLLTLYQLTSVYDRLTVTYTTRPSWNTGLVLHHTDIQAWAIGPTNISLNVSWYQNMSDDRSNAGNSYGFVMVGTMSGNTETKFHDSKVTTLSSRPTLFVNFTVPSTTPTLTWEDPTPPDNARNNTFTGVTINANCTLNGGVSLWWNNSLIIDNSTTTSSFGLNNTLVTGEGAYNYTGACNFGDNSSRLWNYDISEPTITLNPTNGFTALNVTLDEYADYLFFNITIEDNFDLFGFQVHLNYSNGTNFFNYTNESLTGSTIFNYTNNLSTTSLPPGLYPVTVRSSDSHTNNIICPFEKDCYRAKKIANGIDFETIEGNNIQIISEEAAQFSTNELEDRYQINIDFDDGLEKKRIIHLYSDNPLRYIGERSGYLGHFVVFDSVTWQGNWIDFETEGLLDPEVTVNKITDMHYEIVFKKLKSKIKFNSIGGLNVNTKSYLYTKNDLQVLSVRIEPEIALNEEDLIGFVNVSEEFNNTVNLTCAWFNDDVLNFTFSNTTFFTTGEQEASTYSSENTSLGDEIIFSCFAQRNNFTTAPLNSSITLIFPGEIRECGTVEGAFTYNYTVMNMSYYDEITLAPLELDEIGFEFQIVDAFKSFNLSDSFVNTTSDTLCTEVDPVIRVLTWDLSGQVISIKKEEYATRTFAIDALDPIVLTNTPPPTNLSLYLVRLNESNTIIYTWLTTAFQPIDGQMKIYRCQSDGSRILVESPPIINGKAIANIELLNTLYSYEVFTNGELFQDFDSYSKCHIEAETAITITIDILRIDISSQIGLLGIPCNVTKTGNNTVRVSWGENEEDTSTITGCLEAYRGSISNDTLIEQACTSVTNTITRTIASNNQNYFVRGKLFQSGFSVQCPETAIFHQETPASQSFGATGLIGAVLLVLSLALIFATDSGENALIAAGVGVVVGTILASMNIDWKIVTSIVAFLLILVITGRYSRQNE